MPNQEFIIQEEKSILFIKKSVKVDSKLPQKNCVFQKNFFKNLNLQNTED